MTPEIARQIERAKAAKKPIERGLMISGFSAWSLAVMAAVSALFAVFSLSGFLVFVALVSVASIEFSGRAKLKRLEAGGPRRLFLNQWLIAGFAALYCSYQIFLALSGGGVMAKLLAVDPAAAEMLGDLPALIKTITAVVYGVVLVTALGYQAGMAYYYRRLAKHLAAYRQDTPQWVAMAQAA